MGLKSKFIFLFFLILFIGCKTIAFSKNGNTKSNIEFIELSQTNYTITNNVKVFPTYYITTNNNKDYKYPLESSKWNEFLQEISSINYKELEKQISTTNKNKSNSRLVVRDLKSTITIKDSKGIYQTKQFTVDDQLNGLENLFKELESLLPLR